MREGNVSILSVCLCVCLCVCLSVWSITFESLDIETWFLVCWYILTISRSSFSIKVMGSRSRSLLWNLLFWLLDPKFFCYSQLRVLIWSSMSRPSQGQGHYEVIPESNCKCLDFYPEASGRLLSECLSYLYFGLFY